MMTGGGGGGTRERRQTIKLLCPALSSSVVVPWMITSKEQRLDLGAISRCFGLDPATLKLNGHFISRGVDLIASSVTWKSLLSFFSARGLSTGAHDADALIIDGKLCHSGTKRAQYPSNPNNGSNGVVELEDVSTSANPQLEDAGSVKKIKLQEGHSGYHGVGLKRKQWWDDVSQLKRLRANGPKTGAILKARIPCSYSSETNRKRTREEEAAAPCKRTR